MFTFLFGITIVRVIAKYVLDSGVLGNKWQLMWLNIFVSSTKEEEEEETMPKESKWLKCMFDPPLVLYPLGIITVMQDY